jgi:hypothetical protein
MLDRFEPILKFLCLALAALLLINVLQRVVRPDPLGRASVPPLPTLTVEAGDKGASTNATVKTNGAGTNALASHGASHKETNSMAKSKPPRHGLPPGFPFPFGGGGPPMALKLPTPIQSRIDRIKESEILGPVMHPMPMALLGIADDDVFLRAPDGQTGMVKEGGELGGVKLLRVGTNRVLVEQDGEKKELTLFSGYGGDSLLPNDTNTSPNATVTPDKKENP